MKRRIATIFILILAVGAAPVFSEERQDRGPRGYAGPGWSVLFGTGDTVETASLAPVMFRLSGNLYLGPTIAYEESASEGPGVFLGGARAEYTLRALSRGFYSTSLAVSLLGGAADINEDTDLTAQINAELNANVLLFPGLALAAGPIVSLRLSGGEPSLLPGITFALKEGTTDFGTPAFGLGERGTRIGGYWQGLWTYVDDEAVFIDGGGTRLILPSGLAFGITGGVLRQEVSQSGSDLAIAITGLTAEWNFRPNRWFTITPRVATGVALYGWVAADDSIDGGPHFMVRPDLSAYIGLLPFLELGGGVGYQVVAGKPDTVIPLDPPSSLVFIIAARVGHRD